MNHSNNKIPDHIYIVGAGGITTYFLPAFIKTMAATTKDLPAIHIIDGDAVEERNLARQLFDPSAIAKNKAIALVEPTEMNIAGFIPENDFSIPAKSRMAACCLSLLIITPPADRL